MGEKIEALILVIEHYDRDKLPKIVNFPFILIMLVLQKMYKLHRRIFSFSQNLKNCIRKIYLFVDFT